MDLLRLEYDIQHHIVLSRKNVKEHALIRMIVSTLSTPEELFNLRKKDFRKIKGREFEFETVRLTSRGKSRISPVDKKTYEIVMSLENRPFQIPSKDMDAIVRKYSPKDRMYNTESLRNAVIKLLEDASLFEMKLERIQRNTEVFYAYMLDFNPLYSGMWELEDEEVAEDFILNYSYLSGISDAERIAAEIGESSDRVKRILESKRKGVLFKKRSE
jgi:hypothetical protein